MSEKKEKEYREGFLKGVEEGSAYNSIFNTLGRMIDETVHSADYMRGKYEGTRFKERLDKATKK
ncbi:hypothetical protein LM602_06270 [Candidatus Acetothermia bacterium]|jgi:hypothetical protein|nr:hypothetical protein [Candidatus Acetothermia bacterium]MCI2432142.1 hypothetical protein [Candidatus Acetothermia bacterium]MCI2436165.1 hypothetical protein [Candidatus Acetothermia bacterium]